MNFLRGYVKIPLIIKASNIAKFFQNGNNFGEYIYISFFYQTLI